MAPVVNMDSASKMFDGRPVLRNVTLTIRQGEFVSLIGRSGCGKSTLLRMIAGLVPPDSGRIDVSGEYAFGFQDARLVPWLKVWDNITLGIDTRRKFRKEAALLALRHVQLPDMADVLPHTLSGGQMQRVSLARALVRQPNLLLLDEPFGALDALTRWDMQDLLLRLRNEHGFATIMVTHDIGEALRLSDRVLVLRNGTIREELRIDRTEVDTDNRPSDFAALERRLHDALHEYHRLCVRVSAESFDGFGWVGPERGAVEERAAGVAKPRPADTSTKRRPAQAPPIQTLPPLLHRLCRPR